MVGSNGERSTACNPASTRGPTLPGSDPRRASTQPSCIHILPRRQPSLLVPHRQDRWLEDRKEEAVECVGQLAKLNENKMANRCAMRQRPNPKREVPSQPAPAGSSGSCSSWHMRLCLQQAVPAFRSASSASSASSPATVAEPDILSFAGFFLILIHTAIHVRTCYLGILYVQRWSFASTAFPPPSAKQLPESVVPEIHRLTGTPKIAGFREEPGAKLLLNAPCWLLACPTPSADGAAEMRY